MNFKSFQYTWTFIIREKVNIIYIVYIPQLYSQLLCMDVKVRQWRRLMGKKLIHLKYKVEEQFYRYPGPPERWTNGS